MIQLFKRALKRVAALVCDQYLVLFFILTTGTKLYFFNTYITRVTWSGHYMYGIVCGYLSVAIIFAPLFFMRRRRNKTAVILALLISVLLLIDNIYFKYFTALPTVGLLSSLGQTKDIVPALGTLLKWWFPFYFIDIVFVLVFRKQIKSFFLRLKEKYDIKKSGAKTAWTSIVLILIAFWMTLLLVGLNTLGDVFNKSYDGVSTSQYYGVLMTHAIDVVRFVQQETTSLSSTQVKTLTKWVKDNKPIQSTNELTGLAKGKNVIMIQVESLGGFVINQKVNGKELTPNLDELARTSHYFPNERFLYGAGHTSDTDFVANSSYFPLPDAAVFVRYGRDDFTGLPKTLISNGYSAFAYHGFNRDFWNRNVALKSLGYQKFYAADNYPKGEKINMGLNDGDFLSKTAEYIKDQPKPSLSYVITLTSHVPFNITDQTKNLGLNPADFPNQVGGYLENVNYVDRMLGKFFDKLKSSGLYEDSLILVYGDHIPVLPAFEAGTIKYDPASVQVKEVPLIIKLPKETIGETHANQGAHIDIMPTVLDLLGIKTKQLMFGQSLFANDSKALKVCSDQLVAFSGLEDCNSILTNEKNKSATIIRYNQFDNLGK